MPDPRENSDFESFYVIRIDGDLPRQYKQLQAGHGVYLSPRQRLSSLRKAARFPDIEAAESFLIKWRNHRRYKTHIQLCTLETRHGATAASAITRQLMRIPYPYRRTAYNWLRGVDVISLLKSDQAGVYERHYKFLMDYGIDITQQSAVRILPRKKKPLNMPDERHVAGPRAYFSQKGQRPEVKTDEKD